MTALLLGSISTVADTSEMQRAAFNQAFADHGLDWNWDQATYREMLTGNGGAQRIADYAAGRDEEVDAAAVHATKSALFQDLLAQSAQARPGVVDTVRAAKEAGWHVGLVTTTSRANLEALFAGLDGALTAADFDVVTDVDTVAEPKPAPDVYADVLATLGESADAAVAVEDNVGGVESASAAGVAVLAFPNANTEGHDFGAADRVEVLDFTRVAAELPVN